MSEDELRRRMIYTQNVFWD